MLMALNLIHAIGEKIVTLLIAGERGVVAALCSATEGRIGTRRRIDGENK